MSIAGISCILILLIAGLIGFARGTGRTAVRAVTIVAAAVLTLIYGHAFGEFLASQTVTIDGITTTFHDIIADSVAENATLSEMVKSSALLESAVDKLPALIATAAGLVILFLLLRLAGLILYWIVSIVLHFVVKRKKKFGSRLGGMLIHIVCALLSLAVILIPVLGTLSLADKSEFETLAPAFIENSETVSSVESGVYENPILNVYKALGIGKYGYNYLNNGSVLTLSDGTTSGMMTELSSLVDVMVKAEDKKIITSALDGDSESILAVLENYDYTYEFSLVLLNSNLVRESLPGLTAAFLKNYTDSKKIPEAVSDPAIEGIRSSLEKALGADMDRESAAKMIATTLSGMGKLMEIDFGTDVSDVSKLIETLGTVLSSFQANADTKAIAINMMTILANDPDLETYSSVFSSLCNAIENDEDTGAAAKVAGSLVEIAEVVHSLGTGDASEDSVAQAMRTIAANADESTMGLVRECISEEVLKKTDIPAECVEQIEKAIPCLLEEIGAAIDETDFSTEAKAVVTVMSVIENGNGTFTPEDAENLFSLATQSEFVQKTVKRLATEDILDIDSSALGFADVMSSTLSQLYADCGKTADEIAILDNLADILNVTYTK